MGREDFKKKEEIKGDEIIYSSNPDFSNNPMAEKLAELVEKSKIIKSKEIEPQEPQKPFTRQNAENLVKAALGEDVFKREEKKEELKPQSVGAAAAKEVGEEKKINKNFRKEQKENIIKDAIDKQIFDMESELRDFGKSQKVFDKVATLEQKEERKKKIAVLEQGIKDAKAAKEAAKLKWDNKKTIRPGFKAEIVENQSETYGNVYAKKSTPEDALEENFKQKEIKAREEFKKPEEEKENVFDLTTSKSRQEEINRVWQREEVSDNEKEKEKFDLTTPEGRQKEIERIQQEESEKPLAALDKQEEKIEQEVKREKPWIREKIEKTASWYKKQPLKYKILFSLGCMGVASASALMGGAVGASVAAAAFTGSMSQRILGGIATFVTAEGLLRKAAEKGGRERTEWEARRHTLEAAVLAALVGSGKAAEAVKNVAGWVTPDAVTTEIKTTIGNIKKYIGLPFEQAVVAQKAPVKVSEIEIKPEVLEIGNRGPEGVIIDYFRENPDVAVEKFDCPKELYGPSGKITDLDKFNEWAGTKAHQLWLADANEALAKPETLVKLKELGYSQDAEGYAKMMHRIGKGFVELDSQTGKIDLVDTEYLKARIVSGGLPVEQVQPIKVPPEYFDGSKKMLYEEDIDRLNKKYPAEMKEISYSNVQNWLEDKAKIDVKKSSWLNEKSLERLKIKEIMDSGFAKPQGVEAYTTVAPEWGSPQWWEAKEKLELQDKIGKILRAMPAGDRIKFQDNSVINFLKEFLKTGGK